MFLEVFLGFLALIFFEGARKPEVGEVIERIARWLIRPLKKIFRLMGSSLSQAALHHPAGVAGRKRP